MGEGGVLKCFSFSARQAGTNGNVSLPDGVAGQFFSGWHCLWLVGKHRNEKLNESHSRFFPQVWRGEWWGVGVAQGGSRCFRGVASCSVLFLFDGCSLSYCRCCVRCGAVESALMPSAAAVRQLDGKLPDDVA